MPVGKIKWFNGTNGCGFIETCTGKDLFVHFSAIQQKGCWPLREGREIQYEAGEGPKGAQAESQSLRAKYRFCLSVRQIGTVLAYLCL